LIAFVAENTTVNCVDVATTLDVLT